MKKLFFVYFLKFMENKTFETSQYNVTCRMYRF